MSNFRYQLNSKDTDARNGVLVSMLADMQLLPVENTYIVTVSKKEEGRRACQNALNWVWVAQTSEFYGENTEYMHGLNKCKILFPMMCKLDEYRTEAMLFRDAVRKLSEPKHAYWLAERCLRTKTLSVKHFANYLNLMQDFWADQGLLLTTRVEGYDEAIRQ